MRKNSNQGTIRKVLTYIKKYLPLVVLSILLALGNVVLTLYVPILTGDAIDLIVDKGLVDIPGIMAILLKIVIAMLATAVITWVMNTVNNHITYHVVWDIRRDAFAKLQKLPLSYMDSHAYGDIVSRVISDVDTFAEGLLMGFTQAFTGVMTIFGTLMFMLLTNVPITLVVVCVTPLSFVVAKYIAKSSHTMFAAQQAARGKQTALIEETIGNQKVVQAFGQEESRQKDFEVINESLSEYSLKATFFSSLTNPCTRFVNSIVYALVAVFGAFVAIRGGISVGRLSCLLSYANQYTKPFNEISGVITELQNALVCAGRIFDLIAQEEEIPDSKDAIELSEVRGEVSISDVSFSYRKDVKLLTDINVQVQPGQRVAIVGPTGCGKTTIINLLMRFYDVDEGSISVDGNDIRKMTRGSLRTNYGMVLQETWLRSGTILDNLRMGKPEASREEVIEAAKAAHAHSFIKRLPKGYDTVIGEDGGSLSQGQKQLLCIARVMLCLPPMLILDEATSSIDTRTEILIQKAFARMMEGRTSFIVAHRLSTVREADVILVMRDGKIVEMGNHAELLAKGGFYSELYNSQFAH